MIFTSSCELSNRSLCCRHPDTPKILVLQLHAMRFEPCRQHQMRPQFFHRLIDCKSRGIGGNLKEHLAGLTKIDGVKILAIHHGCDVVLSQRPAEPVALALNQSKAHVDPPQHPPGELSTYLFQTPLENAVSALRASS